MISDTEYKPESIINLLYENTVAERFPIILPSFQRAFVWDDDQQKRLLLSLLADVPLGTLLMLQARRTRYASQYLCCKNKPESDIRADSDALCRLLLDGQQRLSVLKAMFTDIYHKKAELRTEAYPGQTAEYVSTRIYTDLEKEWYLRPSMPRSKSEKEQNLSSPRSKSEKEQNLSSDLFSVKKIIRIVNEHLKANQNKINQDELEQDVDSELINLVDRLENASTDAFEDHIVFKQLYEGDIIGRDEDPNEVIRKCIDKGHIPLWLLCDIHHGKDRKYGKDRKVWSFHKALKKYLGVKFDESRVSKPPEIAGEWATKVCDFLEKRVNNAKLLTITLPKDAINKAVIIFQQINKGGEPLSVYDLVVATRANMNIESKRHPPLT